MFAVVKADQVIKVLNGAQSYTDTDRGIHHPSSIFRYWSTEELKNIGIYKIVQEDMSLDKKTEHETDGKGYTIGEDVVTMSRSKKDKDIDKVKESEIDSVNGTQHSILSQTDWYYIRKADKDTAIPDDVQNYRDAVRTAGDDMITAITAVSNKADFQALYPEWDEDGNNTGGDLNIWPDTEDYDL
jgi:hypothetical protein